MTAGEKKKSKNHSVSDWKSFKAHAEDPLTAELLKPTEMIKNQQHLYFSQYIVLDLSPKMGQLSVASVAALHC